MKSRSGKTTASQRPDPVPRNNKARRPPKSRFSSAHARGRSEATLPADRSANEQESASQGSE